LSLLTGVELICLVDLIGKICVLGVVSSVEPLDFAGVQIPTFFQMLLGAWQLLGVGILVGAGVGAVYRVETHLRLYQLYWQCSTGIYLLFGLVIAWSGSLCGSVVSAEAMKHGTAVVCGFVDVFMLAWGIVCLGLCIYFSAVCGAAADEIVEEIPTGLLEKFRRAEEAKAPTAFPDYGAAGPPLMAQWPVLQAPVFNNPAPAPVMQAVPTMPMQPVAMPAQQVATMGPATMSPIAASAATAQPNPFSTAQ
jgi:hypothetical protein